ncbi:MAG: TIR domain-containing protein [Candidatus Omnitrophota bacterium]
MSSLSPFRFGNIGRQTILGSALSDSIKKRRVFYSFHYVPDCWRASQIRSIGALEGNSPVSDNDWEEVKRGGDDAIKRWIDNQLEGKSCTIVLIGTNTAGRKWIDYEINKSWQEKKGIVGIHIHNLKSASGIQSPKGINPFSSFTFNNGPFSNIVRTYDPAGYTSTDVYKNIQLNLASWVDEAINIRNKY